MDAAYLTQGPVDTGQSPQLRPLSDTLLYSSDLAADYVETRIKSGRPTRLLKFAAFDRPAVEEGKELAGRYPSAKQRR